MTKRKLTNKEMFELPDDWKIPYSDQHHRGTSTGWENPKVDITKYRPSIIVIYEVDQNTYKQYKNNGGLCQEYENRFYIA